MSRKSSIHAPRLLAKWQRAAIWIAWLTFFGMCVANSDQGEFTLREFLACVVAIIMTFACVANPAGRERIRFRKSTELRGVFRSRVSWVFVLMGAALSLIGIAATFKIGHDLYHGLTTVWGVVADFLLFFLELFLERSSRGVEGDVTESRLYILIFLLPIGLQIVWFNLVPLFFRGVPFRIQDGQLTVKQRGEWLPLQPRQFRKVTADGITIDFQELSEGAHPLTLPLSRVFSDEYETRVEAQLIADFVRMLLERAGFQIEVAPAPAKASWVATVSPAHRT